MFVTSPNNQVIAIDVKTGNLLWRYRRPLETPAMNVPHQTNRGVALYGDKVYFAAGEAVLVALDARTGREVWTTCCRRQQGGLLHDAGAARRRRCGDGGRVRRRVRHPWFRRRLRSSRPAKRSGAPTPCPRQESLAARRGRRAISGRPAARRCGSLAITIPRRTSRSGVRATAVRRLATSGPATIST